MKIWKLLGVSVLSFGLFAALAAPVLAAPEGQGAPQGQSSQCPVIHGEVVAGCGSSFQGWRDRWGVSFVIS